MITINLIKDDPVVRASVSRARWRAKPANQAKQRAAELRWRRDPKNQAGLQQKRRGQAEYLRTWTLRTSYGLTPEKLDALIAKQEGRCAICRELLRGGRYQHIDHARPGTARGVLCSECNTAIGKLHDDPALLERAAAYIRNGGV